MAGYTLISSRRALGTGLHPDPHSSEEAEGASPAQSDLWIFRDGRKLVSGRNVVRDLERRLSASTGSAQSLLDALIQAGELEAALADANSEAAAVASQLTDLLAWSVCSGNANSSEVLHLTSQICAPASISISPPEGFTYYALHPLDFAALISRIPQEPTACALIGIRSIGTTLSAICGAALKQAGREVSRITVRPTGHPYARHTEFTPQQVRWIYEQLAIPAQILIVDEGPGRSGSTFLSVAEALIRAGVPSDKITILGSREPDPESLCASHAAARWKAFQFLSTTPFLNSRFEQCTYVGGGDWRQFVFGEVRTWPESWTQMERLKFLSPDEKAIFKFEGMGAIGAEVRNRAFVLADAGLCPPVKDAGDGFLEYSLLQGRPMRVEDLSSSLLEHMAQYCAFRASSFAALQSTTTDLRQMLEFNVRQEFGRELVISESAFFSDCPVLCDGRMQPFEWIGTGNTTFLKTDAISHGDDHFFPGPCDILWDLAGIAIEWQLDRAAQQYLLSRLQHLTGKNISAQLPLYMLAYSVFRLGFCKMGISTVRGSAEEERLTMAYRRYRAVAKLLLEQFTGSELVPAA